MLLKINGPKSYFWQWDSDRQLVVDEDSCGEVHFCNGTTETALVCKVFQQDGQRLVNVPNILLQKAGAITAYLYAKDGAGGLTWHRQAFQVMARTRPDDYVYTETEVKRWGDLEQRLVIQEQYIEALERRIKTLEDGALSITDDGAGNVTIFKEATLWQS